MCEVYRRLAELERARRRLAHGDDPQAVLEALSQRLTNKLLHGPTRFLSHAEGESIAQAVDTVQRVFQLNSSSSDS